MPAPLLFLAHAHGLEHKLEWAMRKMDIGIPGYFVLFGLLFSCGLGVPIPEDIPLLVAGALIGSGHMHLALAAALAWLGIVGGDCCLYYFGHKYGLNITRVPVIGKHVTRERILKAERLFAHYGVWVVAVGRFFAGIRGAMVIAAGTIRFNFLRFVIADGLAAMVSGGLFIMLGYLFGKNLAGVAEAIHRAGGWILAGLILVALVWVGWKLWRRSKHCPPICDVTMTKVETIAVHRASLSPTPVPAAAAPAPAEQPVD